MQKTQTHIHIPHTYTHIRTQTTGKLRDFYHTCYALSGISVSQHNDFSGIPFVSHTPPPRKSKGYVWTAQDDVVWNFKTVVGDAQNLIVSLFGAVFVFCFVNVFGLLIIPSSIHPYLLSSPFINLPSALPCSYSCFLPTGTNSSCAQHSCGEGHQSYKLFPLTSPPRPHCGYVLYNCVVC